VLGGGERAGEGALERIDLLVSAVQHVVALLREFRDHYLGVDGGRLARDHLLALQPAQHGGHRLLGDAGRAGKLGAGHAAFPGDGKQHGVLRHGEPVPAQDRLMMAHQRLLGPPDPRAQVLLVRDALAHRAHFLS
jgi:hypothetical protein